MSVKSLGVIMSKDNPTNLKTEFRIDAREQNITSTSAISIRILLKIYILNVTVYIMIMVNIIHTSK